MKKRTLFASIMMIAMMIFAAAPVMAASGAPKVESCKVKAKKKVEVEFVGKVQFKNPSVKVTDSAGKTYAATIVEKDSDEIEFNVKGLKAGKKYSYKISGIRKKGASKYTTVKGSFRIAGKTKVVVEKVDYDGEDREVTFEFQGRVKWKNAKVKITDSKGNNYVKRIREKDNDEIEVSVKKLTRGKKYKYTISGVSRKGSKSYKTVKGSFTP